MIIDTLLNHHDSQPDFHQYLRVDGHYVRLESITVYGPGFKTVAVGIDCIERIVEYLSYTGTFFNTQTHECQNSQIGV